MPVEQIHISPPVYSVQTPLMTFGLGHVKCFFIQSDGEWLMIDTGAPSAESQQIIEDAIRELNIDKKKLRLFLTHLHIDHAGLIDQLFPDGVQIYVGKTDMQQAEPKFAERLAEELALRLLAEGFSDDIMRQGKQIYQNPLFFTPAQHGLQFVEEGLRIFVGDLELEALKLTGHTAGQLALWEPRSGLLIAGDHILFDRLSGLFWNVETEACEHSLIDAYKASLLRLKLLPIKEILSSHDTQNQPPNERIDAIIQKREARIEALYELVAARPGSNGDHLVQNMGRSSIFSYWEEIPLIQRFFIAMDGLCTLDHLVLTGRILRNRDKQGYLQYSNKSCWHAITSPQ